MAVQHIPGRNGTITVINDSYAPFGEIAGPAEPAEDPSRYRPSRKMWKSDVLRKQQWTAEQLETAIAYRGFPKGAEAWRPRGFGAWHRPDTQWNEREIDRWNEHNPTE
jgi:hypothetical protein